MEALNVVLFCDKGNQELLVSVDLVWIQLISRKWGALALKCEHGTLKVYSDKYDLIQIKVLSPILELI